MIYMDYMATTPMDPLVLSELISCTTRDTCFANAASTHWYGEQANQRIDSAVRTVAAALNCDESALVWTSGATESNNLAIIGAAHYYGRQKKHLITVETEHKAVLDPCIRLAKSGYKLTVLPVEKTGLIDLAVIEAALHTDTLLVSVMAVNNEIGVIQPIADIAKIVHAKGALLHVDAVQAVGKIPVSIRDWDADLVSFSAHKIYGPKGIGLLYVRQEPKVRLQQRIYGGSQQGLRAGTLPVQQIVAMAKAIELSVQQLEAENKRIKQLRDQLWNGLQAIDDIEMNGDFIQRVPHNLNITIKGVNGDAMRTALYSDIAVSSGSACNAVTLKPSHVLIALGRSAELADASLRISLGKYSTEEEVEQAVEIFQQKINWLRNVYEILT